MEKRKRKQQKQSDALNILLPEPHPEKAPDILLLSETFQFDSSLPIEECAYRLRKMDSKSTAFLGPKIFVDVFPIDENTYRFQLRIKARIGDGWLVGELQATDTSTLVGGKYGAAPDMLLFVVLGGLLLLGLLLYNLLSKEISFATIYMAIIIASIFGAVIWFNIYWAKLELIETLEKHLRFEQG